MYIHTHGFELIFKLHLLFVLPTTKKKVLVNGFALALSITDTSVLLV